MYTREGCRGGQEQFKWKDIKEQDFKDREQYLGASTKVGTMAKFGRYYVHDWYAKKRDTASSIAEEREDVQKFEEQLMQEALGLKPKKLLLAKKQLSEEEIKEILKKDSEKNADKQGREMMGPQKGDTICDANGEEVEASILLSDAGVKGLGFAAHRNAKLEKYKEEILGTESKLEGIKFEGMKTEKTESIKIEEVKNEPMTDTECLRLGGASSSSSAGVKKEEEKPDMKTEVKDEIKKEPAEASASKRHREAEAADDEDSKRRKSEKKAKKSKKAEKKAKKKVKKAAKKVKKAAKLAAQLNAGGRRGACQSSDSSSSSS